MLMTGVYTVLMTMKMGLREEYDAKALNYIYDLD